MNSSDDVAKVTPGASTCPHERKNTKRKTSAKLLYTHSAGDFVCPLNKEEDSHTHRLLFLQWNVPPTQINQLLEMTVDDVQSQFEDILNFRNQRTCMKEAALLDYYVSGFWWAKEANFSPTQLSFTMAVLQMMLDNMREKQMSFVDNWYEFAKALEAARQHAASEGDINPLLDVEQAIALTDYLKNSLFQNYRLYEFLFTKPREEILIGMKRTIDMISNEDAGAPLEEGMSADLYFHYLAPPPIEEYEQANQAETAETQHVVYQHTGSDVEDNKQEASAAAYSTQEVKEMLAEVTKDMLGRLQAEFSARLRIQEETYTAKLEHLKKPTAKD